MDSSNAQRPSLPPIHFLEMENFKREEMEYQRRKVEAPGSTTSSVFSASYPPCPPPPYSAAAHPPTPSQPHTLPPDSRPHHIDDTDHTRQTQKRSLPSLQEALGVEKPAAYPSDLARNTQSAASPISPPTHMLPPPAASNPYAHSQPAYAPPQRALHGHPQELPESRRPEYADMQSSPVAPTPQRLHAAHMHSEPHAGLESAQRPAASATQQGFPYGYASYPAHHTQSHGPSTSSTAGIYQPSVNLPPSSHQSTGWPDAGPAIAREQPRGDMPYGESVKRHLDMYDFEMALSEIAEHSTVMLDFSRSYGARLHQSHRGGPPPGALPAITEVDELMNKSRRSLDALNRLREVLVAQQAVYFRQAQEQRFKSESEAKRNDSILPADEAKGGFAGGEAKKRRGRAAAPGRCHSCNRAETPEWRRGPDGARTLCNACGLHYAKLTRKAGASKAAIGSSNLQPKSRELDDDEA